MSALGWFIVALTGVICLLVGYNKGYTDAREDAKRYYQKGH